MTRSVMTAADYKYDAETLLGLEHDDNDLDDDIVKKSIIEYMKYYRSIEVLGDRDYGKTQISVTIPTTGYDLKLPTVKIYDYVTGFEVYIGSVYQPYNRLLPVRQGSTRIGYYIQGNTLYLNNIASATAVVIVYQKATEPFTLVQTLASIIPDIDTNFEDLIPQYIKYKYYMKDGDNDDVAREARDEAKAYTQEKFNLKRRITAIS